MDVSALAALIPAQYLAYVSAVVAIAAALSTVLPVPAKGSTSTYAKAYAAIQFIAFNFGNASNVAPKLPASTTTETK